MTGDVVVGNLHLSDFHNKLPGALDFVLQWTGGPKNSLNDLNLAVFSPLSTASKPDFVANPPFTVSLTPGQPVDRARFRATSYPETSRSGGSISKNSFGPDGLELASWPASYPVGTYRVVVFNFLDAKPPPTSVVNPVTYTIDVFLNGKKLINTFTGSIGLSANQQARWRCRCRRRRPVHRRVGKQVSPGMGQSVADSPKVLNGQDKLPSPKGR